MTNQRSSDGPKPFLRWSRSDHRSSGHRPKSSRWARWLLSQTMHDCAYAVSLLSLRCVSVHRCVSGTSCICSERACSAQHSMTMLPSALAQMAVRRGSVHCAIHGTGGNGVLSMQTMGLGSAQRLTSWKKTCLMQGWILLAKVCLYTSMPCCFRFS